MCISNIGKPLPDTNLEFDCCIRDPQSKVYHIEIVKRKQLYCKDYNNYRFKDSIKIC